MVPKDMVPECNEKKSWELEPENLLLVWKDGRNKDFVLEKYVQG